MRVRLRCDIRTCFVSLPPSYAEEVRKANPVGAVVLELVWEGPQGEARAFASWNGAKTSEQGVVELGEAFGACLGLHVALRDDPFLPLSVGVVDYAEYAGSVEMEPCSSEDWDLVELHAADLESLILTQVVVVFSEEVVPIFLHTHKVVHLRVLHVPPSHSPRRLGPETELLIAPKPRRRADGPTGTQAEQGIVSPPLRVQAVRRRKRPCPTGEENGGSATPTGGQEGCHSVVWLHPVTLAGLPLTGGGGRLVMLWADAHASADTGKVDNHRLQRPRALVYILPSTQALPGHILLQKGLRLVLGVMVSDCVRLRTLAAHEGPLQLNAEVTVTLRPIHWRRDETTQEDLDGEEGTEDDSYWDTPPNSRDLRPTPETLRAALERHTEEQCSRGRGCGVRVAALPAHDNAIITLDKVPYLISLSLPSSLPPPPFPYLLLHPSHPAPLPSLAPPIVRPWVSDHPSSIAVPPLLGGVETLLEQALQHLTPTLGRGAAVSRVLCGVPPPSALLLHGQACRGKTSVCRAIAHRLLHTAEGEGGEGGPQVCTVWVDCQSLRGHKMTHVLGHLTEAFNRCRHSAPSLLILDDVDALSPMESDDAGEANTQAAEIAEHLRKLWMEQTAFAARVEGAWFHGLTASVGDMTSELRAVVECGVLSNAVAMVATCKDPSGLHVTLRRAGMLETQLEVPPLDGKARCGILRALLERHSQNKGRDVQVEGLALGLEGCSPADLHVLVARAAHHAVARSMQAPRTGSSSRLPDITEEDLSQALEGFTPASLRGAKLFKSDVRWDDIGGLAEVQAELKDVLELPVRFAPLFARLPMRLPTGVLLYGPPGCGKTLLAGAVARECSLNFISVKGPEVLDKYIGASELAVRNLFGRAAAASPCVLFFDEFEALAPRRGSDNSGVTDRVVNQLLTFLDGVEGRSGVYVMGATSRPDLIDPALLRPGRLDRQLYCGFPSGPERAQILQAMGRKLAMDEKAREALTHIGHSPDTDLLTGADLQALLGTAQLNAIHDRLACLSTSSSSSSPQDKENGGASVSLSTQGKAEAEEKGGVQVTKAHLYDALASTRPSISGRDRAQYRSIYDRFQNANRKADFRPASATDDGTQRTALK